MPAQMRCSLVPLGLSFVARAFSDEGEVEVEVEDDELLFVGLEGAGAVRERVVCNRRGEV
jgi:hypothetical protein